MSEQDSRQEFLRLAVGVAQVTICPRGFNQYPYPPVFQHSLNVLARRMAERGSRFPSTITAVIRTFQQPIADWWPLEPKGLPVECVDFPLLDRWFDLDNAVEGYLQDFFRDNAKSDRIPEDLSLSELKAIEDNEPIRRMIDDARKDVPARAAAYVEARAFIIRHPYLRHFGELPANLHYRDFVNQMYTTIDPRMVHQEQLWQCPYCHSLLLWIDDQPRCARDDLCGALTKGYTVPPPESISLHRELMCLNPAGIKRTLVPGKPELDVYKWLLELKQKHPGAIREVDLWPGVDVYDLRVVFNRQPPITWAIDLKDIAQPHALQRQIDEHNERRSRQDESLGWQRFFYVVPDHRRTLLPGYLSRIRRGSKDVEVLYVSDFQSRVSAEIARLSGGR